MKLHHVLPLALAAGAVLPRTDQRHREKFARRRLRHRRPVPIAAAAALVGASLLLACDITQEHIDEASEVLAGATVASGTYPTDAQVSAGATLQATHVGGSSWRWLDRAGWPHAFAVVTFGTNGRAIWHMEANDEPWIGAPFWRVSSSGLFAMSHNRDYWHEVQTPGVQVDQNHVCFHHIADPCALLMQRVTP